MQIKQFITITNTTTTTTTTTTPPPPPPPPPPQVTFIWSLRTKYKKMRQSKNVSISKY